MPGMSEESSVVLLSLENVDEVFADVRNRGDVLNRVLPLLFVIWWVRYLEILLVPIVVYLHKPKLGKAVLVADAVQAETPYLNT